MIHDIHNDDTDTSWGNSTPWLMTRRRTCPICKGDVVRSLNQRSRASTTESSQLPIDVEHAGSRLRARRGHIALPVDYDAEDGLPIMSEYDGDDDEDYSSDSNEIDLERGITIGEPEPGPGPGRHGGYAEADNRSLRDSFGDARES